MPPAGITAGPDGALCFTSLRQYETGRITTDGEFSRIPRSALAARRC